MRAKGIYGVIVLLLLILSAGCTTAPARYQQTMSMMDTQVTISLYAQGQDAARKALHESFSEMRRIERVFSAYENTSAISHLNREKSIKNPSPEIVRIFRKARYYGSITNGSFDITVQPLLDLYSRSFENKGRPPTAAEINATLADVGFQKVSVNDTQIRLHPGMKVTLGGIVKGYAIDRAHDVLLRHNITSALIDAGGDMRSIGKKPSGESWRVAVQNPDDRTEYLMNFALEDMAVATSGNYERYFNTNKSFHHIVDPRTGYSAQGVISATVLAPTAQQADALSTSVFVMGPEQGLSLLEELDGVEAMVITENRTIQRSSGFPRS